MKDHESFPGRGDTGDSQVDTDALVQDLVAAARLEEPDAALLQRIGEQLSYRRTLNGIPFEISPRTSHRFGTAIATSAVIGVAAAAWLWLHPGTERTPLSPEQPHANIAGLATSALNHVGATSSAPRRVADPCAQRRHAAGNQPLIDDFEDGDDAVLKLEEREGLWRWARDTDDPRSAPALLPIPRPNPTSSNRMALHVKGGRLQEWGAVVEFNFKPSCYDASSYAGLTFQAKGPGRVFVAPREVGTIPEAEGGTCVDACYNPHVSKVELEPRWKTYRIEWREFEQRGYGRPPFDPTRLHSIAFLIRTEDTPYDVWIDSVAFLPRLPH